MSIFVDYKIIPVINFSSIEEVDSLLLFLREIDHKIVEITLRNEKSFQFIEYAKANYKDFKIGVGTIINELQLEKAINLGVDFLVSPGYTKNLLSYLKNRNVQNSGIPYIPGASTISEIMELIENDFRVIKLFPINIIGGIDFIKSINPLLKEHKIKFIPTGGITFDNIKTYLEIPNVIACGSGQIFADHFSNREKIKNIIKKEVKSI